VSSQYGGRDETCPVSKGGETKRVHLEREGGGGGKEGGVATRVGGAAQVQLRPLRLSGAHVRAEDPEPALPRVGT
jgi:hypothetical protein